MEAVNVSNLTIAGRVDVPDPKNGQVSIVKNLRFEVGRSYSLDFGSVNQGQIFGVVRSMFVDNSSNPNEIEVTVMGTDQYFTIPPYSEGYFNITARIGSQIILASEGGATDVVTTIFYNFDINPVVWYKYGAANKDIAQKTQGALPDGANATGQFSNGALIAGVDPNGKVRRVSVDANGNLVVSNLDITLGATYGPDAPGSDPSHPGILIAGQDNAGKVRNFRFTADDEVKVSDPKGVDALATLKAAVDALKAQQKGASNSTITTVASAAGNTLLLAANANRKGALIFNDSVAPLKVALSDDDATAKWSIIVQPGSSYILSNGDYTGVIRGAWLSVDGNARVTEFV